MSRPHRFGRRGQGSEGFTLVEAMFAVLLLCSGLLAVATLASVAVHSWRRAGEMTVAVVAVGEIADSFGVFGVAGGGRRQYAWGTVVWGDPIPLGAGVQQVSIRASVWDTTRTELVRVVATVPSH